MWSVEIRNPEQVDLQALHRVRDRVVSGRTRLISQMRAFCVEYGIPIRQGAAAFKADLLRVLGDEDNDLMPRMRRLLADLLEDQRAAETGIAEVTREIEALAQGDDRARRLATIPGIGPLGATALVAAAADGRRFKKARDLAAWLGLVPRQHWTDRKTTLLGSSERGNAYIRRLLIHGARSCVMHLDRSRDRLGVWVDRLRGRMHVNKATVAPANEIARRVGGAHPTGRALPTGRCRSRVSRGASVGFTRLTEGWRNSRSARRKPVLRSGLRACRSFVGTAR